MFLFLLLKILCMPSRRSVENSDKPEELVEWNALIKQLFSPIACFNWHIFQSCSNQSCFRSWCHICQGKLILIAYGWPINCQWSIWSLTIATKRQIKIDGRCFREYDGTHLHLFSLESLPSYILLPSHHHQHRHLYQFLQSIYVFSFNSKESQYHQYQ